MINIGQELKELGVMQMRVWNAEEEARQARIRYAEATEYLAKRIARERGFDLGDTVYGDDDPRTKIVIDKFELMPLDDFDTPVEPLVYARGFELVKDGKVSKRKRSRLCLNSKRYTAIKVQK